MPGGRPSSLTPEVKDRLIQSVSTGNYYEQACQYAGISYRTFRNWMVQGEAAQSGQYFQFFQDIKKAEAQAEITAVAYWRSQMPTSWQAARDFLSRRYHERWGQVDQLNIGNQNSDPFKVSVEGFNDLLKDPEIAQLFESLAKRLEGQPSSNGH